MESKRVFNVENHYMVEIDKVKEMGSTGTVSETFSWDIYIASKGEEYRGKAVCSNRGQFVIPWTTLTKDDLLHEMINLCERSMERL